MVFILYKINCFEGRLLCILNKVLEQSWRYWAKWILAYCICCIRNLSSAERERERVPVKGEGALRFHNGTYWFCFLYNIPVCLCFNGGGVEERGKRENSGEAILEMPRLPRYRFLDGLMMVISIFISARLINNNTIDWQAVMLGAWFSLLTDRRQFEPSKWIERSIGIIYLEWKVRRWVVKSNKMSFIRNWPLILVMPALLTNLDTYWVMKFRFLYSKNSWLKPGAFWWYCRAVLLARSIRIPKMWIRSWIKPTATSFPLRLPIVSA